MGIKMDEENRSISIEQYRGIDISIFFLLTCALEILNIYIFNRFFSDQNFCISVVFPITLLVMQRWNAWAVLIAAGGGIAFCIGNGDASFASYLVYGVGNCFMMLNLFWYKAFDKKKISESALLKVLFAITGYLCMSLGRTVMSLIFEGSFIKNLPAFLSGDALNAAIGILIIIIAGRQNGLFEDQRAYLIRQAAERAAQQKKQDWIGEEYEREED